MSEETAILVTVVDVRGDSAVVEFIKPDVGISRAVIPVSEIVDGQARESVLEMGVPYGLPWEAIAVLSATPETLARALRERGIWTLADLTHNQPAAFGAIQSVYGVDLAALIHAAENAAQGV